ncbi:EAL domain-containing response regulator [Pseudoalteromonas ruthenica]|uniref:EAL domain-containing response regulator n=1 Tax=Pseudoalteromonas ruthenica TaxID=151081 RepID=UPI001486EA73|nr:EAL domain-containing response regulator [Pseudoalteromonas ruthenica]
MTTYTQANLQHKYRVAIVDDSPAILVVLRAVFNELGIEEVSTFDDAESAYAAIEKAPSLYDIVLTDLNMPGMDGMAFMRKLGELKYGGAVVIVSEMHPEIIALAARVARQHQVHLLGNIEKPVHLHYVEHLIQKLECLHASSRDPLRTVSEIALLDAISHSRVLPLYQPKRHISNGKVVSLEVMSRILPRYQDSDSMAECFVDVARDNELLNLLTFQLIEKAAKDLSSFRHAYGSHLKLAINLHPCQLADLSCPDKLALILSLNQLAPADILIEMTEHQPLNDKHILETISRLKMRGFELSLDDFGSGFTEEEQLRSLPLDEIKVGQPLISHIERDNFAQQIVYRLDDLATDRKLRLCAVGLSSTQELDYLAQRFPHMYVQGPLVCKPLSREDLLVWLEQQTTQASN